MSTFPMTLRPTVGCHYTIRESGKEAICLEAVGAVGFFKYTDGSGAFTGCLGEIFSDLTVHFRVMVTD